MSETTGDLRTQSAVILEREGISVGVTFRVKGHKVYAGGPAELELSVTNKTPVQIFYLAGAAGVRPAYLKFSAELHPHGLKLRDPYPDTSLDPQGLFASLPLQPGQVDKQVIVLNQYVTLEDTREVILEGQSGCLNVRWQYFLAANRSQDHPPKSDPVEGEFQLTLLRNDARLWESIESIAGKLIKDANAIPIDSVGRRDAIVTLTSLRIPEVMPYLRQLVDFPDFEVRRMAQYALSEFEHESKR